MQRGRGYWKFNNSLLNDERYISLITNAIRDFKINNPKHVTNPHIRWDAFKCFIRGSTIQYTSIKRNQTLAFQTALERQIKEEETRLTEFPNSLEIHNNIKMLQTQYESLLQNRTNGAIVRSRAKWVEAGEKNTKYFLNLEKRNSDRKTITKLNRNNKLVTTQTEILKELTDYFSNLYKNAIPQSTSRQVQLSSYIESAHLPKIQHDQRHSGDTIISAEECKIAIDQLSCNKSPGFDGFSVEFYQAFWSDIKDIFLDCINYSFEIEYLSSSQYQGVITLLPKPDKDHTLPSNYRPITLLNCDYKILSKVLNNRIQPLLNTLVGSEQSGFIKGRYIGHNVRLLFDFIEYMDAENLPGAVLSLDICKAFDSLQWDFIFKALKYYNLDRNTIKWIEILYKQPQCCIINNNNLSPFFQVSKGVRQGDPLSPTLFVLSMQCLAKKLNADSVFTGVKIGNDALKLSMFADDTIIFLNGGYDQFKRVFVLLNDFENFSGCRLNLNKSQAFFVGSRRCERNKPFSKSGLCWPDQEIKYLGIWIPIKKKKDINKILLQRNFGSVLDKMKTLCNIWSSRGLSLLGKITIAKCLLIPQLTYKIMNIPVAIPKKFLNEINRILFTFIWGSKWERVARKTLCGDFHQGGLKMIDLESFITALQFKNVYFALSESFSFQWKIIEGKYLDKNIIYALAMSNIDLENRLLKKYIPLRSIVLMIQTIKKVFNANITNNSTFLWLNKNIKYHREPFYIHMFSQAGILDAKQLINNRGVFKQYDELNLPTDNQTFIRYIKLISAIPSEWDLNTPYRYT